MMVYALSMTLEDTLRYILAHPSGSTTGDVTRIVQAFRAKYDLVFKVKE